MMIQNVWAVLCKESIEDRQTGSVSLVKTVTQISAHIPPDPPPVFYVVTDFVIVSLWTNPEAEHKVQGTIALSVSTPSGREIQQVTQDCKINPRSFYRWFVNVTSMQVEGEGRYNIILRVKEKGAARWKRAATIPFDIVYNIDDQHTELPPPGQ